jgi:transposase
MTIAPVYVGIDVSKDTLDLFDGQTGSATIPNTPEATQALAIRLALSPHFVVFEATGAYDGRLRRTLEEAGIPYARINPERARDFARALGFKAKTDRIDARMLALFGERLQPPQREPANSERAAVAVLHRRRDQLVSMRVQEKNRRSEIDDEAMRAHIERHVAWLDTEIAALEAAIAAAIRANDDLRESERLMRSMPGVGPVVAATLIALMPELGTTDPKKAAALAGLAPFAVESGRFKGLRTVRGGRKEVRDKLYIAAVSAARTTGALGNFFRRLREKGKPAKVALIALARKMLTILNAIVRDRVEYIRPGA